MSSLNDFNLLLDFLFGVEAPDPDAVGVPPELVHGLMQVRQEEGEGGHPEVAKVLKGAEGSPHLWSKRVVVVGQVPCKP